MTALATLQREVQALRRQVAAVLEPPVLPASPLALAAAVGLVLDPWQVDVVTSTTARMLLNCCRQSGKSTTVALLALYVALTEPGALVLMVAPAERQSAELLRKVADFYGLLGRPVPALGEAVLHLELANGSRLLALPGKTDATVRGYSAPRLVIIDEAARVDDALMGALRPMLATAPEGRLLALSTPWGRRGWWHQAWTEGGAEWERVQITAPECPRISAEYLESERQALPRWIYEQEYLGLFGETEGSCFAYDDIAAAFSSDVEPLFAEVA